MSEPAGTIEAQPVRFGAFASCAGFVLRIAQLTLFENLFARFTPDEARLSEFSVLATIADNPGIRQGVLADALRIKWPNMAKIVRNLEARGLVTREIPEHDRRSVELRLTPEGRKLVARLAPEMLRIDREAMGMLTDEEYATLTALLGKVAGWNQTRK